MRIVSKLMISLSIVIIFCMQLYSAQKQLAPQKSRVEQVKEASLERERKYTGAGIRTKTLAEIESMTGRNQFTQTEAYFQIPELRELVTKKYNVVPYMDVISQMLTNEGRYRDTHWAFYHGNISIWRVAQDLYTKLYYHFNKPKEEISEEFTFLRFQNESGPQAQQFLLDQLKAHGLVDDTGESKAILLSTNISLFGNSHSDGESSWRYFILPKGHAKPQSDTYESIMKTFGLTNKYVKELMALEKMFHTKEQAMIQIFVPKEYVDEIGYLAWMKGIPAHDQTINWVRANIKNKTFRGKAGKPGRAWAAIALTEKFKKEQEKNPIFRDLVESVKSGDFSLDSYLKIYCNKPTELPSLDYAQARLIFTPEILLNPNSGIKIFRFNTVARNTMEEYNNRLDAIIKKILAEKRPEILAEKRPGQVSSKIE